MHVLSGHSPNASRQIGQDTKGSSFHVQLFHVEIPNWLSDGQANDAPKEHLLGLIRQETPVSTGPCRFETDGGHALTILTKFLKEK